MKDKILNKFSVESNGETIEVITIQTDKGITVNIIGTTMDVFINNDEVYSKYDNPEYKNIPSILRPFIEKNLMGEICTEKGKVECAVYCKGDEYYVSMPTNRAKKKDISFYNWLESYEKIQGYDVEIPNAQKNFDKLIEDIKNIGYIFKFAWDGNEYDNTFELLVPINEFDEDRVYQCFKLWKDYNKELNKYIDKI